VNGGISKKLAAFPTIKFPDQNKVVSIRKMYADFSLEIKITPN